ncbi:serine hydrolase domain-containing protein [Pseudomonas sp. Gutcm_11s]|uniref:serine hydrolase domain-containing protein n=1 Tax=Pseudomonas sp. Gutcm_11s TaxID=3026088 RepID=UPI002362752A|nr:serine hydrolase domain-containing protein [Pseudomonas sp. Gutcm_11s]MDD0844117.1 serine hydrolase [Pseudomonas sp. Gutcm_11s]
MPSALFIDGRPQASGQPVSRVPWWSFTKTALAATALTLVRDGLLGLDEPVAEGPFTLRQLLRHEAGLADYSELAEYHAAVARHEQPWPAEEMLQRLDATRLRYQPGVGWRYSNVGYLYVARIIERSTGLVLEQALQQRLFAPLGLTQARLARTPADLQDVSMGSASAYHPGWVYHGLLVGPLDEAALLLDRLLTGDLLPPALLQAMHEVRVLGGPLPGRPWTAPGYALGLMQGPADNGLPLSGHTGGGPGSVVAVYHCAQGERTATGAVFAAGAAEGAVEAQVVHQLAAALIP